MLKVKYSKENAKRDDVGYTGRVSYVHHTIVYRLWCFVGRLEGRLYRYGRRIGAMR